MYTLFQINSGIVGSTGNIMKEIDRYAQLAGMRTYMASVNNWSSRNDYPENHFLIGTKLEKHLHRKLAMLTGNEGGYSYWATKRLLKQIDAIKPDIIQLHNLHWCYINLKLLFAYFKENPQVKVVWTLHDCWAFTGHCPHYEMIGCSRWQTGCHDCPIYRDYPASCVDNSRAMFTKKKRYFTDLPNLTLVTPSKWLNSEVKKSFLQGYPTRILHNGIDVAAFDRRPSDWRAANAIGDKFVIMGTAYNWSPKKGFDVFLKLADILDETYQIVLVGNMDDQKKAACCERGILTIPYTSSKEQLAELYSASDVFFNPTREEMFGLVNIEAQACGTPVITFRSGGSTECIDPGCGYAVEKDNLEQTVACLERIRKDRQAFPYEKLRKWAKTFDSAQSYEQYIRLYNRLLKESE